MLHRNKNPVAFRARLVAALGRGRARAGPVDGIGGPVERKRCELFAAARALFAADDETARILPERLALAVPVIGDVERDDADDHRLAADHQRLDSGARPRSEAHTSALQSLMRISYAFFCLEQNTSLPPAQHFTYNN